VAVATNIFGETTSLATLAVDAFEYIPDSEIATSGDLIESDDEVKSIEEEIHDEEGNLH